MSLLELCNTPARFVLFLLSFVIINEREKSIRKRNLRQPALLWQIPVFGQVAKLSSVKELIARSLQCC